MPPLQSGGLQVMPSEDRAVGLQGTDSGSVRLRGIETYSLPA